MLADAAAYGIALAANRRGNLFKANTGGLVSGAMLLALGVAVLAGVARRSITDSSLDNAVMMATATLSLIVKATVLRLLGRYQEASVHLRATWIFTRADVIANVAVLASGFVVLIAGFRAVDLSVGAETGLYTIHEAVEIVKDARLEQRTSAH